MSKIKIDLIEMKEMSEYADLNNLSPDEVRKKNIAFLVQSNILGLELHRINNKNMYLDCLYNELTDEQLSSEYDYKIIWIKEWRKKHNLPENTNPYFSHRQRDNTSERVAQRRKLIMEDYTFGEIVKIQGISPKGLRDWIVRNNLTGKVRGFE